MATEHATVGRRRFYSSFPQMGPAVGFLLYCTMIAVAIMGLGIPIFAALSVRVGRRSLCLLAAELAGHWAFPCSGS
jgi:hypothetical protein